jgi:CheY-like chemotaxis protein
MHAGQTSTTGERASRGAAADVLVVDPREDHRELMAQVLEPAFPGAVWLVERLRPGLSSPRVLVVSLQGDPGAVLDWLDALGPGGRPSVIALTGPDRRWSSADERRLQAAGRLDKRAGNAFLKDLVSMIRDALAPAEVEAVRQNSRRAVPVSTRRPAEAPAVQPPPDPRGEGPIAPVLELVTEELVDRARYLARAAEQLGEGLESAGAPRSVLAGFQREAARCRALTGRLAAMLHGEEPGQRRGRHRVRVCDLLELREAAWKLWAGESERLMVRVESSVPPARVFAGVMGPALDALVSVLFPAASGCGGRVVARCDTVLLDEGTVRRRPGLQPGRYSRLRLEIEAAAEGSQRPVGLGASLRAGLIAAAKSDRGYFEDDPGAPESPAFTFYLPVQEEPASACRGAPTIAVVDDDEPIRDLCHAVVEEAGARPSAFSSGEELLSQVRAGCRYDLVLLDLDMPGLDGAETYRRLCGLDGGVPVVLVTGSASPRVVRPLLGEGVLGVMLKPFDVPTLMRVIHCALGGAGERQELPR